MNKHKPSKRTAPPGTIRDSRRPASENAAEAARFPMVGIGCSAGGLTALERFFSKLTNPCGMAIVVVQHLDPAHPSALPELLQRLTPLTVLAAADRLPLRPEHIYVAPPNCDLSIQNGRLRVSSPAIPPNRHLSIDGFLRSMASDCGSRAIGVVLSGMGTDGALGLRAIKEAGGLTVAQDPATAGSPGMPSAAIGTGLVDLVAAPENIAARIVDYLHRVPTSAPSQNHPAVPDTPPIKEIVALLHARDGNDFSHYKSTTLYRRIERRTALHQLADIDEYVRFLRKNPQEVELLFKELLIGVTNFFRDPAVWAALKTEVFPALIARYPAGRVLRAWVTACSSGEEAYSLAMVFREVLADLNPPGRFSLQIFATDLDTDAIARARKGRFLPNIATDVSAERLSRFFSPDDDGYRVNKEIRDMVVFAPQNIISDPPFTKLDILCCRNLLIYFESDLQKRLLPMFHYALNDEGILVLGNAESIGGSTRLFAAVHGKERIFRRRAHNASVGSLAMTPGAAAPPASVATAPPADRGDNIAQLIDLYIQQTFAPAAVLINPDGDIVYFSGRTGKYLEPAAGKVNINIHAMARPGLRETLVGGIQRAARQPEPVQLKSLRIDAGDSTRSFVNITIQQFDRPDVLCGKLLVVFGDAQTAPVAPASPIQALDASNLSLAEELRVAREELRLAHEEMQGSLEELKSTNEEMQSTNEELQSTNEELTTSKEEMQSLNEELQTVNAELQSKVDDLTWERNDMMNLLNSIEVATVFLDNHMHVRRFTKHATSLFKLIPGDIGRPLSDVVNELDYPEMIDEATEVLRSLMFVERQVRTHDGRWFRVRIMPYRTQDNVIDGVVGTFIDITATKHLEAALRSGAGQGTP